MRLKKLPGLLWLLVLSFTAKSVAAQVLVSGKVTTDDDKPLAKANVYVNGSTAGTTTAEDGSYTLAINNPGFVDIIASYIGYTTVTYHAELSNKNIKVTFKLSPKEEVMRDVLILTSSARTEWLRIFKQKFLGITPAAEITGIENEDAIAFAAGDKAGSIRAFSDDELIIINKYLGYKIYFQLIDFYYDKKEGRSYFVGFSRFTELKENGGVPARYIKHRKAVYYGSAVHFYHSLINKNIEAAGFTIRQIIPAMPDTGKTANVVMKRMEGNGAPIRMVSPQQMSLSLPIAADSVIKKVATTTGTDAYSLQWKGKLQVYYKKDPEFKYALSKKTFIQGNAPRGAYSYIELLEGPALMDKSGSLANPLAVQFSGFWSYDQFASMLPVDYRPE